MALNNRDCQVRDNSGTVKCLLCQVRLVNYAAIVRASEISRLEGVPARVRERVRRRLGIAFGIALDEAYATEVGNIPDTADLGAG